MYRVKIYGAGSIGNHLANASRVLGWDVTVCDVGEVPLNRMKNEIYPGRYGKWDEGIKLFTNEKAPKGGFDVIMIGTPPDSHIPLALEALQEAPTAILSEKPLCPPGMKGAQELYDKARKSGVKAYVGYTHVAGRAMAKAEELLAARAVGDILTIDSEFREHWEGIFKAHPWLSGPQDTYLGFWEKGGGASGEHSHAINLWQHLAHAAGFGRVREVSAMVNYSKAGPAAYDDLCFLNLRTERGFAGRVVQDVVTRPSSKKARLQGTEGVIEWIANHEAQGDAVILTKPGAASQAFTIPKKRPDDFIDELRVLERDLSRDQRDSALSLERGLDTMLVLAAAHESERTKTTVVLPESGTYEPAALRGK